VCRGGYAFGDGDVPARRLALLAAVFGPTSRDFLVAHGVAAPPLAVDLGCGPGHTTRLLNAVLRPERTLGLDVSADFVARAARQAPLGVSFAVHDVATAPFPCGPPALVFARFLVAHLAGAEGAVARWGAQLAPGGLLLLEEVEAIETRHRVFAEYLERLAGAMARRGQRLDAGGLLREVASESRVVAATPAAGQAAAMFRMNLDAWCEDAAVRRRLRPALEELLADGRTGVVTWRLRQAVLKASRG
jgi:trans-aconitate 2-methyltransferase